MASSPQSDKQGAKMDTISKKILVIDDNETVRDLVSKVLCRLGYEVSSVDSGEKGLSLFLKNGFDLVITDLNMPGMDGLSLAHNIKEKSPSTHVVLMTGSQNEDFLSGIKRSAVDRTVFKPFKVADIDQTVQTLLQPSK
jgi:two-component system sensor histidine kinase EvgS